MCLIFIDEEPDDLTLVGTCHTSNLPKLRIHIANSRYKMKGIQGIILAHVLSDHIQAANENFSKMHSWLAMINRPM
jgi:hypothetical protein